MAKKSVKITAEKATLTQALKANQVDFAELALKIKQWGQALGFQQIGISDIDLTQAEMRLKAWLAQGFHGEMRYLAQHADLRCHPEKLLPETIRIISARMDYLPPSFDSLKNLKNSTLAYISRYALGRDYHKLIRKRLTKLAEKINAAVGQFNYRAFADSAPIMEKPIAEKAGLGWIGKHTVLINKKAGSWFFLGELFTNLPLPIDQATTEHCGSCSACLDICPTQAIVAPFQLDARRCISYLTIEFKGSIPLEFRQAIGNRIFGCDDCQLICPWNKFAKFTAETAFHPRHQLDQVALIDLFAWDETTFLNNTEGSAIRRATYIGWLRNIAIALGNAEFDLNIIKALQTKIDFPHEIVREHVNWALQRQFAEAEKSYYD